MRISMPFIGGPTLVMEQAEFNQLKENTMNKINAIKELKNDKAFQQVLLKSLGYTVVGAIAVFGVFAVWKWFIAYKMLTAAGGVISTSTWLKAIGVTAVVSGGSYVFYKDVNSFLDKREAELKAMEAKG